MKRRVLLIQTAFIGDVVLTTPALRAFRRHFPEDELFVLVKPEAVPILQKNPHLTGLLVIDKKGRHRGLRGMTEMVREIRSYEFDILLSPHQSHRTSLLSMRSQIPLRIGYESAALSRLAYHRRLKRDSTKHEIHRIRSFVDEALGVDSSGLSCDLEIHPTQESENEARQLLQEFHLSRPILLAPSSVWPTKRWTVAGFCDLAQMLVKKYKKEILLIGSPADHEVAQNILTILKKIYPESLSRKVINVCGKTSLLGLYSLMTRSALLVSNDSAPVHFGCAARLPVVALFGPTTPALGYAPIAPQSVVVELAGLGCRPCGTHGGRKCPEGHFRCMKDLSAREVMRAVETVYRAS